MDGIGREVVPFPTLTLHCVLDPYSPGLTLQSKGDTIHENDHRMQLAISQRIRDGSLSKHQRCDTHYDAGGSHYGAQAVPDNCHLPKDTQESLPLAVEATRKLGPQIGTRAY